MAFIRYRLLGSLIGAFFKIFPGYYYIIGEMIVQAGFWKGMLCLVFWQGLERDVWSWKNR